MKQCFLVLAFFLLGELAFSQTFDLIIKSTNVINVQNGQINRKTDVGISDGRIQQVDVNGLLSPDSALQVINGHNQYLIPGFWDNYTHTSWQSYKDFFPLLIANGVLGIGEMYGNVGETSQLKVAIDSNQLIGPVIARLGAIIDGPYSNSLYAEELDETSLALNRLKELHQQGVTSFRVLSNLSIDNYYQLNRYCQENELHLSGLVPWTIDLDEALNSGQMALEQFSGMLPVSSNREDHYRAVLGGTVKDSMLADWQDFPKFLWQTFDTLKYEAALTSIAESNAFFTPQIQTQFAKAYLNDPSLRRDNRIKYIPAYATKDWKSGLDFQSDTFFHYQQKLLDLQASFLDTLTQMEVPIIAGTDMTTPYIYPGFSLHDELEQLVKKGLSPLEAIQAATINPVHYLGQPEMTGIIEYGQLANLVLLANNPLEDIQNTKSINGVILKGRFFSKNQLNSILDGQSANFTLPGISGVLAPIVAEKGVDKAIAEYKKLKENSSDWYNFDELELNTLGYQLLELNHIKAAIKIFELNVKAFPESFNTYDSLGEAYMKANEKEAAISNYKKSLSLNPDNRNAAQKIQALSEGR